MLLLGFAGAEGGGSRVSQSALNVYCERVRATENLPCGPCRVLERRHGLVELVERGAGVIAERLRIIPPYFERQSMSFSESASRYGHRSAQQRLGFLEALEFTKGICVVEGC